MSGAGYANDVKGFIKIDSLAVGFGVSSVEFLAYLTSFNQAFSSNWNAETVYGRADPIGNFQGTTRVISLAWDIPGETLEHAKSNLENISTLVKMLYPFYKSTAHTVEIEEENDEGTLEIRSVTVGANALAISKPPLVRLSFGNLIKNAGAGEPGLLGWIGNLTWTPALDMGMFSDGKGNFYPKVVSLSLDFTVQHEHFVGHNNGNGTPAGFPFGG